MESPDLSIIIPAYNEEKIIASTLKAVMKYLSALNLKWEIIVVDDGSKDNTSQISSSIKDKRISVVKLNNNQGKGSALKKGFLLAKGDYIFFTDADLSVPIANIGNFLKILSKGSDIAIGSRRTTGSEIVVHQPWIRENMGRIFTLLTRIVTRAPLTDFTCGFKGFKHNAAKKIFEKLTIKRWSYDAEILFLAKKFDMSITEIPINWSNRSESRVVLGKDVIQSFWDLIKIRWNEVLGRYDN